MNGIVDAGGRALLEIEVAPSPDAALKRLSTWIDTGFTGELVVPQSVIDDLGLPLSGTVSAVLADGSAIIMKTYDCFIRWFGEFRRLEVVSNAGESPLLGVGLLLDHELRIDYRSNTLTIL